MTLRRIGKIDVQARVSGNDIVSTGFVFYSYAKNSNALEFHFKDQQGKPVDMLGTKVRLLLIVKVEGEEKEFKTLDEEIVTESSLNGIVRYIIPDRLMGYQGIVDGWIYLDFPDGSKTDEVRFRFTMARSKIDEEVPLIQEFYVPQFEEMLESVKTDLNADVALAKSKINQSVTETQNVAQVEQGKIQEELPKIQTELSTINADIEAQKEKFEAASIYNKAEVDSKVADLDSVKADKAFVDAQLAQTKNIQSIKRLSETEPVRVATFDGTNEPVHPSVVYIPNGWGVTSTKYWMACTPWPVKTIRERNDRYECPSLLTSYNGIDWFVHPNTPNPLVDLTQIQIDNGDYYSDPSIVMNGNTMEIWYRWTNGANFNETNIYRITSTNGVDWSSPELVLDALKSDSGIFGTMRAQQIFYDGVTYKAIYGVLGGADGMEYAESTNPSSGVWKNVKKVIFNNAPDQFDPWHTGISISNNIYHMVAYDKRKALDYFVSSDGINFNFVSTISEEKGEIVSSFVDFYQSYPIKIKELWYLFVTGTLKRGRSSSRRDLVIFSGNSLTDLTPVRAGGINRTLYFNEHPVLNNSIGPEAVQNLVYATFKDTYRDLPTGYGMSFGTTDVNNAPAWYSYTKKSPIVFVYESPSDAGGIPPHIGMMWRNTLTKKVWIATGTSSSADWKQLDFISDPVINTQRSDINVADSISVTGIYRGILKSGTGNQISYLTGLTDGQEIILINTAGSNVTLKNSNVGTGSMRLKSGVDRVLANNDTAKFIAVGSAWYEI
ncbi:BppU family phage baseplate upper protein [Enterococcus casseliflavus]|uniref:BppU family phage baseplate upper protein n=1 Tax=Enterococcus casseliflavus TaxID=37734 RepID=UPI002952F894|nr:BppU family phage baseplate upper protein [Enterococcus casseliflavus]MDV7688787.1 BppU family phage baseplate upper protein [Enterococcus casseliflavus]